MRPLCIFHAISTLTTRYYGTKLCAQNLAKQKNDKTRTIPSRAQRNPNFHEKKTLAPSASPSISKLNPNATHFKPHKIATKDLKNRKRIPKRHFQPPPGFPSVVLPAKNPAFQDTNFRS